MISCRNGISIRGAVFFRLSLARAGGLGPKYESFTTPRTAKKVIVINGSPKDKPIMEPAREYFAQEGVPYEETVLSAHRDLPQLIKFLEDLEASGEKAVILAVAGLSAALPGVVVMSCSLPVIGVPVPGGPLNGIDALLAIAQCPGGVPCTTVGLHKKTPVNAAMAAHRILKLAGL